MAPIQNQRVFGQTNNDEFRTKLLVLLFFRLYPGNARELPKFVVAGWNLDRGVRNAKGPWRLQGRWLEFPRLTKSLGRARRVFCPIVRFRESMGPKFVRTECPTSGFAHSFLCTDPSLPGTDGPGEFLSCRQLVCLVTSLGPFVVA